jgi:protein-disulfide isomerase
MRRIVFGLTVLTAGLCSAVSVAQTLKQRPAAGTQQLNEDVPTSQRVSESVDAAPMPMRVGAGTPIKVAIDSEVRVRKVQKAHLVISLWIR